MNQTEEQVEPQRGWSAHLRGHVLLFDRRPAPGFSAATGMRLLLVAALLELARLAAVKWLAPGVPLWVLLPAMLALALLALRHIAHVSFAQLGLRPWREWTLTERSYFVQVIVLANVLFPLVLLRPNATVSTLGSVFVPYLFFGFYQELVYRGMLQSELTRRWGAPLGILAANALYTFGPLHSYYFAARAGVNWPMFAAIFGIGLFFGVLYERSRNLGIVAVFHAIGNAYIVWGMGTLA